MSEIYDYYKYAEVSKTKDNITIKSTKQNNSIVITMQGNAGWGAIHIVDRCPASKAKFTIKLPYEIYKKLLYITNKMDPFEWSAILESELDEDHNTIIVKDFGIPKQKVTQTSTSFEGIVMPENNNNILYGHFHSHPFSKAGKPSFSGQDESSPLADLPYAVLMGGNGETIGKVKITLPCGAFMKLDADVEIVYPMPEIDTDALDNMISKTIEKQEFKIPTIVMPKSRYNHNEYGIDEVRNSMIDNPNIQDIQNIRDITSDNTDDTGDIDNIDNMEYTSAIYTFPTSFRDRTSKELDKLYDSNSEIGEIIEAEDGSKYVYTEEGYLKIDELDEDELIMISHIYNKFKKKILYASIEVTQHNNILRTILKLHYKKHKKNRSAEQDILISEYNTINGNYTLYADSDVQ